MNLFYGFMIVLLFFFVLVYDCIGNISTFTQYFNQRHAYQLRRNQPRRYHQLLGCFQETTVCSLSFLYLYLACFI